MKDIAAIKALKSFDEYMEMRQDNLGMTHRVMKNNFDE